ncbi:MAG: NAAT family transporter [Deltaproteobacteria bacterium]|nr:NAAT family transporter [Deltaproteobacteria bacterium]
MKELIIQAATVFMGFFAIMNPIANTPIFLGLTDGYDRQTKKAVALRALALSFLIILVFCLAGKLFFHLFGISLSAFRITGGILVFMIGYHMLQGQQSSMHSSGDEESGSSNKAALDIAVSPLALPILAGPGTIATAMNYSAKGGLANVSITIAAFAVLCFITYAFFISGQKLVEYIGESAIKAITRMMGLILAVIGMQMLIEGIYGAIHMFK